MQVAALSDSVGMPGMVHAPDSDSNPVLQAKVANRGPDLPDDLLVAVFNTLRHPKDLLACACVCKAWRKTKPKASMPVLVLHEGRTDLDWLITLTPTQMAAVCDVYINFNCTTPQALGCAMMLTFICGGSPRLQRLELDWSNQDILTVSLAADTCDTLQS